MNYSNNNNNNKKLITTTTTTTTTPKWTTHHTTTIKRRNYIYFIVIVIICTVAGGCMWILDRRMIYTFQHHLQQQPQNGNDWKIEMLKLNTKQQPITTTATTTTHKILEIPITNKHHNSPTTTPKTIKQTHSPITTPTTIIIPPQQHQPLLLLPTHVMFSASPRPKSLEEQLIFNNTKHSISQLGPRVKYLYYSDYIQEVSHPLQIHIERNRFGYPILSSLFKTTIELIPNADTYIWFNHDLIFNTSFLTTLDEIVLQARLGKISTRFFGIGNRYNIEWSSASLLSNIIQHTSNELIENFNQVIYSSPDKKFWNHAQDFFICSPTLWKWESSSSLLPLVIGRRGIDNWFAHIAIRNRLITSIDITKTSAVIHQTISEKGNYAGHEGLDDENVDYNLRYLATYYHNAWDRIWSPSGKMHHCPYETDWNHLGQVQIIPRIWILNQTHFFQPLPPTIAPISSSGNNNKPLTYAQLQHLKLRREYDKIQFMEKLSSEPILDKALKFCQHQDDDVKMEGLKLIVSSSSSNDDDGYLNYYVRGTCYFELQHYQEAIHYFKQANNNNNNKQRSLQSSELQLKLLRSLAKSTCILNQYQECGKIYQHVLEMNLGKVNNGIEIAKSYHDIALVYHLQGELNKANEFGKQAILISTNVLGEGNEITRMYVENWGD
jgi:tetratricopeptide (TPR) repeat protein